MAHPLGREVDDLAADLREHAPPPHRSRLRDELRRLAEDPSHGNRIRLVLFKAAFHNRKMIDLTDTWVELDAETVDQVRCTLHLRTEDNPADTLGAGTWDILSARVDDGMRLGRPATIKGSGKYRFTLPFRTIEYCEQHGSDVIKSC